MFVLNKLSESESESDKGQLAQYYLRNQMLPHTMHLHEVRD